MALSSIFSNVEKVYGKLIKGAFEAAKKQGATNTEPLYYMMTTTGKVLFDITDRQKLDDTLVKVTGDVIQGIILKPLYGVYGIGFAIDMASLKSGYSLGSLLLTLKHANEVSFSQEYVYVPQGISLAGSNKYLRGPYFRVGTITGLDGITKAYTDPLTGKYMSAEEISKELYESVYPDYIWTKINNIVQSFSPDHIVSYDNGVLSVTFPDGHIEAKDLENVNNVINGGTKNDVLYGMGGNDTLNGSSGRDTLIGGLNNDKLYGGADYDTYVAGGGDTIFDQDDSGQVYLFNNNPSNKLTGGKQLEKDGNVYEGTTAAGQKVTYTIEGTNLTVSAGGQTFTILSYEKDKSSLDIVLVDKDEEDKYVNVSVSDATLSEDGGSMVFTVTLSKELSESISIDLVTLDGSAVSGEDYGSSSNFTVTIAAGSTSAQYSVPIINDDIPEPTETFTVAPYSYEYSGDEKVLLEKAGIGTIIDDDDKTIEVSVSSAQASERSGAIHFIISISEVLSQDLTVDLITLDGSARLGSDYGSASRPSVTIAAGSRTAEYTIPLVNDEIPEDLETFTLALYSFSYSGSEQILLKNAGTGTIIDDDDPEYVLVHISDAAAGENAESMTFNVTLTKPLDQDITIHTSQGSTTISAGSTSGSVTMTWSDDCKIEPDSTFSVYPTGYDYNGKLKVLLSNDATGTIYDDDQSGPCPDSCNNGHAPCDPPPPPRRDPLVLDLNQDGEISTVSLTDSTAYFDITGDGIKERVGWVQASEGIVVIDKNGNGKIDGISEVFGTATTSGFAELRSLADSNYDGVIDRRDELYNQLKVWQDTNQDGISQANELKTLSQAGVKSIQLDVIGTNINLNGNLLSEAGRYGDIAGERELAADIQLLATERVNSSNTPNTYEIDPITETLPQMRGYGYVDNSFKSYNLDSKIQRKAA